MKSRSQELVDKSIAAMVSAIEIYNKPDFKYREETFSILAINAWELLLKAKWLKDNNNKIRTLYVTEKRIRPNGKPYKHAKVKMTGSGNPFTHGLDYVAKRMAEKKTLADAAFKNIIALCEIRDSSVHFYNKSALFAVRLQEVGSASVRNYAKAAQSWFGVDFSQYNFYLMPLAFVKPQQPAQAMLLSKEEKNVASFISSLEAANDPKADYAVSVNVELKFLRSKAEDAIKVQVTNDPGAPKVQLTEDGMDASRLFGMIQAFNPPEEAAMLAVIGLDIAKRFFQLHSVDPNTGEITRLKLTRSEMMPFFANRQPSVVAMEACGSSHHWARHLRAMGHEVRLIATKFVTPFVKSNKNDAADAQAIWEAAQRPEMRFVPVKSESQQAILALHSMREGLIKARTAQLHQLRAVFYEFGIDLPEGRHWCVKQLPAAFERLEGKIPAMVIEALRSQFELIQQLTTRADDIERKLDVYRRSDERCERLLGVPGVGLLTSTAIVASVGDAREFRSGREFAAWLGVVPRHSGTGGRVRMLSISKRGNSYLRAMLIHCARAVMARQKQHSAWLQRLMRERPWNVAVVALANKLARTIWAMLAHERTYLHDDRPLVTA